MAFITHLLDFVMELSSILGQTVTDGVMEGTADTPAQCRGTRKTERGRERSEVFISFMWQTNIFSFSLWDVLLCEIEL